MNEQAVVAESTADGFRVTLVAINEMDDPNAPSATVKISAFQLDDGSWERLGDALTVGSRGGFFWNVITGPQAIRDFSVSNDAPERVTVSLLITPSIGFSELFRFHVENGRLVEG